METLDKDCSLDYILSVCVDNYKYCTSVQFLGTCTLPDHFHATLYSYCNTPQRKFFTFDYFYVI